jgi:ElaB/YqjD/DUF883 family membrane-anchored ribosome-binding protein
MSDSPEAIRADIDRTRAELSSDVDALADKVTPSKIVEREKNKIRGALSGVRERIMGAAEDATGAMKEGGTHAMSGVSDAASSAKAGAQGNPLAVGLVAFGVGLLAASLIPASSKEKHVAEAVKEKAQPLVDEASSVAREVGEHLKEPAQDAVSAVKDRAQDAVAEVRGEASDAVSDVTDRAQEARDNVTGS